MGHSLAVGFVYGQNDKIKVKTRGKGRVEEHVWSLPRWVAAVKRRRRRRRKEKKRRKRDTAESGDNFKRCEEHGGENSVG